MAFEILEMPEDVSPKGNFLPKADQTKFRSAFYPEDTGPETTIMSRDGRAKLGLREYVSETAGKARNIVKPNGMTVKMKEYIVPIEDALRFEAYAGKLSEERANDHLRPSDKPATETQVGRKTLEASSHFETVLA